jgi:hypothetical protein
MFSELVGYLCLSYNLYSSEVIRLYAGHRPQDTHGSVQDVEPRCFQQHKWLHFYRKRGKRENAERALLNYFPRSVYSSLLQIKKR